MARTKTKEVIEKAERITISHVYDDGTCLFDILYNGEVYVIRQYLENIKFFNN